MVKHVESLTPREAEILGFLMAGQATTVRLMETLTLSAPTVHYHLASIFRKLGVSNRTELVAYAFTQGRVVDGRWEPYDTER